MGLDSIQNYTPAELKAKEDKLNANPPQQADGNLRIDQFFDLLYYVLNIEQPNIYLAPAFPKFLIPGTEAYDRTINNPTEQFLDTITYKITREEPGSIGGNKQPFDTTREVTPKPRASVIEDDKEIRVLGQWFDTLVQFDVWSLTNREADILALWFKRFMMKYRGFFKHMGLSEILYWWRGEDDVTSKLRNSLHYRTLVYYIRTEELVTEEEITLKELQYKIEINKEDNDG